MIETLSLMWLMFWMLLTVDSCSSFKIKLFSSDRVYVWTLPTVLGSLFCITYSTICNLQMNIILLHSCDKLIDKILLLTWNLKVYRVSRVGGFIRIRKLKWYKYPFKINSVHRKMLLLKKTMDIPTLYCKENKCILSFKYKKILLPTKM